MSYRADGDPRVDRVDAAIEELVDALRDTGDPVYGVRVNPAAVRWLNEALRPLGLKVEAT